jgi:hypothetical protein
MDNESIRNASDYYKAYDSLWQYMSWYLGLRIDYLPSVSQKRYYQGKGRDYKLFAEHTGKWAYKSNKPPVSIFIGGQEEDLKPMLCKYSSDSSNIWKIESLYQKQDRKSESKADDKPLKSIDEALMTEFDKYL